MSYFRHVKFVPYTFGTSDHFTLHQNLTAYVDLVDQIRDNAAFYQKYSILPNDRPDTVSQKLYGSTKYYWTFFLMNEELRLRGWPLTHQDVYRIVQKERPNTTLTTNANLSGIFKVGSVVSGATSGATGTIIKRRLDLGQIIIEGSKNFLNTEDIQTTENEIVQSLTLTSAVEEYNSVYEYVDEDGNHVDINPYAGPGVEDIPVTYYDRYVNQNEALKEIIVIKPDAIHTVFEKFQAAMSE